MDLPLARGGTDNLRPICGGVTSPCWCNRGQASGASYYKRGRKGHGGHRDRATAVGSIQAWPKQMAQRGNGVACEAAKSMNRLQTHNRREWERIRQQVIHQSADAGAIMREGAGRLRGAPCDYPATS